MGIMQFFTIYFRALATRSTAMSLQRPNVEQFMIQAVKRDAGLFIRSRYDNYLKFMDWPSWIVIIGIIGLGKEDWD
jgi:hypothetical protein